MKKIIFSLLAVVLFAACGDKNAYKISGVATGIADGTEVSLFSDRRGQNVLETAKVQNGKFEFSKRVISPNENLIFFGTDALKGDGSTMRPMVVFVEAGDIVITLDDKSILGTPLNEQNTKFFDSLGEGASDSAKIKDYIKANSSNNIGAYYFERMLYAYDLEEAKETLGLFPEEFKDNKSLASVRENIKIQEETAVGVKFKDLKGLSPEGTEVALSDYAGKGKVVLIDFWASWCPPCRKDMPLLVEAYAKYKDKGFEIVGVSLDKKNEDWIKGIADLNITWPQISDLKFWESELSKAYAVRSIPFTVLIDGEGNIIDKGIKGADLESKLAELLGK